MMQRLWSEEDGQDIAEYAVMDGSHSHACSSLCATHWIKRDQHIHRYWQFNHAIRWRSNSSTYRDPFTSCQNIYPPEDRGSQNHRRTPSHDRSRVFTSQLVV